MTTEIEPIRRVGWRKILDARRRASRTEYLAISAACCAAFLLCGVFVNIISAAWSVVGAMLVVVTILGTFVVSVLVTIRRLHDWNRSGWWLMAIFLLDVPFAVMGEPAWFSEPIAAFGAISQGLLTVALLIIFSTVPGQREPNRFGPPPVRPSGKWSPA